MVGQALERSDNPAIVRRNVQPLRVGLSKYPRIAVKYTDKPKPAKLTPAPQALRLGLLAGQVLERSDNPAIVRRKNATP